MMPHMIPLKLLVTIVDRGKGSSAVELYRAHALHFEYLCMGLGTATSKTLDYLGLAETEKDVVLTPIPAPKVKDVIALANEKFGLSHPGRGILFTIPLSGVSRHIPTVLCNPENLSQNVHAKEEAAMESAIRYDLILVIVNRGNTDLVMDAARAEGARGGTVLHARRVGFEDKESLFGFALQPEKEIVTILTPRSQKLDLMKAINKAAGLSTAAAGILFSLPVSDLYGLSPQASPGGTQRPQDPATPE